MMKERGKHVWVIGGGGREHALVWRLSQSPKVARLTAVPGSLAMAPTLRKEVAFACLPANLSGGRAEFERLARLAIEQKVDLVVVGPDNPLADGIVDIFSTRGLTCFGPSAAAARLESSKAFAKEVMSAAKVPTARFAAFESVPEAKAFLRNEPWGAGWVVKADGLALGKGVVVPENLEEAFAAIERLLPLSGSLLVEERLHGEELSWLALCDGERAVLFDPARDHKRLLDGDQGPNTGGMGVICPVPGVSADFEARVASEVFAPVMAEMKRRGTPFRGVLYAGLMWNRKTNQYWVLEFNARFGDPETQALLPRMEGDLFEWCLACAEGRLKSMPTRVPFREGMAVVVVLAAEGYPESPRKGDVISGLESWLVDAGQPAVFASGVSRVGDSWMTHGGRVLGVLGYGLDVEAARRQAYERVEQIRFAGQQFRRDIGQENPS